MWLIKCKRVNDLKINLALAVLIECLVTAFGDRPVMSYDGYKTYRVIAYHEHQLSYLKELSKQSSYDFWSAPRRIGKDIDVMVSPELQETFMTLMVQHNIPATVLIDNYQDIVNRENHEISEKNIGRKISFDQFYRYNDIVSYSKVLAQNYPKLITVKTLGITYEGRDIIGLIISSGGNGTKNAILIEAGIHGREWIAPAVILFLVSQLVENYKENAELLKNLDWLIVPVTNPDGYEFTHTTNRMWRKNRNAQVSSRCRGIDPNRNFGFHWGEEGASEDPCSETFRGTSAFSEKESVALRDFALAHKGHIKIYLALHSYGPTFLYPWGYTLRLPKDWRALDSLALSAVKAITAMAGTKYEIGSSTQLLYAASGGSDDYMKGVQNISYSYTVELPGGGNEGFNPPASKIRPIAQETFEGFKVLAKFATKL